MPSTAKILKTLPATETRQFLLDANYEVYEKIGPPTGALTFHCHDFYEIIYILSGEFDSEISEKLYHLRKGDFLLIPDGTLHKYHDSESEHKDSSRIIMWVRRSLLEELAAGLCDLTAVFDTAKPLARHFPIYYEEQLRSILFSLAADDGNPYKSVQDRGNLTLFFSLLNRLSEDERYISEGETILHREMIRTADQYMEEHLSEAVSLEMLANAVHLSKYHFLRCFKAETGMTVHAYLLQKRLLFACRQIENGVPVSEAAFRSGFNDYSVFLKNFKSYFQMSPREYLKLH